MVDKNVEICKNDARLEWLFLCRESEGSRSGRGQWGRPIEGLAKKFKPKTGKL
jgi:ribosomal protein L15E